MFLFDIKKNGRIFLGDLEEMMGLQNLYKKNAKSVNEYFLPHQCYPGNYVLSLLNDQSIIIHHENVDPDLIKLEFQKRAKANEQNVYDASTSSPSEAKKRRLDEEKSTVSNSFPLKRELPECLENFDANAYRRHITFLDLDHYSDQCQFCKQIKGFPRMSGHLWDRNIHLFYLIYEATENAGQLDKAKELKFSKLFFVLPDVQWFFKELQVVFVDEITYKFEIKGNVVGFAIYMDRLAPDGKIQCECFEQDGNNFAFVLHDTIITRKSIADYLYKNEYRNYFIDGQCQENQFYGDGTNEFDFVRLPNNLFLEILSYLPFRERYRCRRVSNRWTTMSDLSLRTDAKEIHVENKKFKGMKTDDFQRLLSIVAGVLEKITIDEKSIELIPFDHLISSPTFGSLRELKLVDDFTLDEPIISCAKLFSILDKCPKLETLTAYVDGRLLERKNPMKMYDLTKLDLMVVPMIDSYLMNIADCFPKLFWFRLNRFVYLTESCLSAFAERYGDQLIHLELNGDFCERPNHDMVAPFGAFTGVRTCTNLEYLSLEHNVISDSCLIAISTGCQKLETLELKTAIMMTTNGLAVLANLPNLKRLNLFELANYGDEDGDVSEAVIQIAKAGHLEQLVFPDARLSVACIKACVRYCPNLFLLHGFDDGSITANDTIEMIKLYGRYGRSPRLVIRTEFPKIWRSKRVRDIQSEVKEGKFGHRGQFVLDRNYYYPNFLEGVDDDEIDADVARGEDDDEEESEEDGNEVDDNGNESD